MKNIVLISIVSVLIFMLVFVSMVSTRDNIDQGSKNNLSVKITDVAVLLVTYGLILLGTEYPNKSITERVITLPSNT